MTAGAQTRQLESTLLPTARTPGNLYDFGDFELTVERVAGSIAVIKIDDTETQVLA